MTLDPFRLAIGRKVAIAAFHRDELAEALHRDHPIADLPPIDVQAHFEALVRAPVSIFDQILAGIATGLPGMPEPHQASVMRVEDRLLQFDHGPHAVRLARLLVAVDRNPALNDARDIRNRATHRHYDKSLDQLGWYVESPQYLPPGVAKWTGDRHLLSYGEAMLDLSNTLSRFSRMAFLHTERIERELEMP